MAVLSETEFESFLETETGLNAYVKSDLEDIDFIQEKIQELSEPEIKFKRTEIEQKNWNAEWESNFHPILVNESCYIRAEFHEPRPEIPYEIVIQPKMSFGTGHHETTWLVMSAQLGLPHEGAELMDVGSGTGILGILGKKLGAKSVLAFDIEDWAVENAIENADLNNVSEGFEVFLGTIENVDVNRRFDGILANINRNILLREMEAYNRHLKPGGWMIISGFYEADAPGLARHGESLGLTIVNSQTRNDWAAITFRK